MRLFLDPRRPIWLLSLGGVVITIAPAADACEIRASREIVVVTGVAPGATGALCTSSGKLRSCRAATASKSGLIASSDPAGEPDVVWFETAASAASPTGEACSAYPRERTMDPVVLAMLSAALAFLAGVVTTVLPLMSAARARSRELAGGWVSEYRVRLRGYAHDASIDPSPRPLPTLGRRERRTLGASATLAEQSLGGLGNPLSAAPATRRDFVDKILAKLAE